MVLGVMIGLSFLYLAYLWFYQAKTAGRSYENVDELFRRHIPARKGEGCKTDAEVEQDYAIKSWEAREAPVWHDCVALARLRADLMYARILELQKYY